VCLGCKRYYPLGWAQKSDQLQPLVATTRYRRICNSVRSERVDTGVRKSLHFATRSAMQPYVNLLAATSFIKDKRFYALSAITITGATKYNEAVDNFLLSYIEDYGGQRVKDT
jgi:hypothetical protein